MADDTTFGTTIREARLARGLSMGQLASSVGRTAASVRRWERDESVPSGEVVGRLAGVLEVDTDVLEGLATSQRADPVEPSSGDPFDAIPGSRTGATPVVAPAPTAVTPEVVAEEEARESAIRRYFDKLFDSEQPYLGYLRAALTVLVIAVLAYILIWAGRGLLEAIGDVWDSFGSE